MGVPREFVPIAVLRAARWELAWAGKSDTVFVFPVLSRSKTRSRFKRRSWGINSSSVPVPSNEEMHAGFARCKRSPCPVWTGMVQSSLGCFCTVQQSKSNRQGTQLFPIDVDEAATDGLAAGSKQWGNAATTAAKVGLGSRQYVFFAARVVVWLTGDL